jgi:hypothetical protein
VQGCVVVCWEIIPLSIGDSLKNLGAESEMELSYARSCFGSWLDDVKRVLLLFSAHLPEADTRIDMIEIGLARGSGTRDARKLAMPCEF